MLAAAIVAATAAVGGGVYNAVEQADARDEQKKLQALEQAKQSRQQIAQARIAAAQVTNAGAASGTTQSSAVQGGVGAIGSQMASNLGFQSQTNAIQSNIDSDIFNMGMASGITGMVKGVAGAVGSYEAGKAAGDNYSTMAVTINKNKSIFSNPASLTG